MAEKYNIRLSPFQEMLFRAWDKLFPPTAWKRKWATEVAQVEGYENHWIIEHGAHSNQY